MALALLFQIAPFLVMRRVFGWHWHQPEATQGGMLLLSLATLLTLSAVLLKGRLLIGAVALCSALYLRLNTVLVPALAAWLYLEILLSLGRWVTGFWDQAARDDSSAEGYLSAFVAGVATWSCVALALSALGMGGFQTIRVATLFLAVLSLTRGLPTPAAVAWARQLSAAAPLQRALQLAGLALLLLLVAKSNRAIDYDSLWYGLRPEYVLIGEHSFFDNLGLVNMAHYNPKLLELLMLPLSNLGDYSFIIALNIGFLGMLGLAVRSWLRRDGVDETSSSLGALLVCTVPAVANISATAKPDIFTALLLVLCARHLGRWAEGSARGALWTGLAAGLLALGSKATGIPMLAALVIGMVLVAIDRWRRSKRRSGDASDEASPAWRQGLPVALLALMTLIGITARTVILTGVPLYKVSPTLDRAWQLLGFHLKYPFNVDTSRSLWDRAPTSLSSKLSLWGEALFYPDKLPHIVMLWLGNAAPWLLLVALLFVAMRTVSLRPHRRLALLLGPVVITGMLIFTVMPFWYRGGDGNYHMLPVILALFLLLRVAASTTSSTLRRAVIASCGAFIVMQTLYLFISHSSWQHGTARFRWSLAETFLDTHAQSRRLLAAQQLTPIERYIAARPRTARALAVGPSQLMHRLPCRLETVETIVHPAGVPALLRNERQLVRYLRWAKIDYLIVPQLGGGALSSISSWVGQLPRVVRVVSPHYVLFQISAVRRELETHLQRQRERRRISPRRTHPLQVDLWADFGGASKRGDRPLTAPWKRTIAKLSITTQGRNWRALFMAPPTSIAYTLTIPAAESYFGAFVGFHPAAQTWKVSDGVRAEVWIESAGKSTRLASHYLLPASGYRRLRVSLARFLGKRVRLTLRLKNDRLRHDAGDWAVWITPAIYVIPGK